MANALPANAGPGHLQQLQDKDTSTIPLFYGNQKDTVTLQCFINRIDTGVRTLNWTQNIAFTYFQNATRSTAAAWLESFLVDNPDQPQQWQIVKPHFRKAFGDSTDPIVFAQEVFHIRPHQFNNSLFEYYNAISRAVKLHEEEFTPPPLPPLPENHQLTEEEVAFVTTTHENAYKLAIQTVHAKLRKEFFLNGLSKAQLDLVVDKPHITTVHEMIAAIHQHESVQKKKNGNGQATTVPSVQSVQSTFPQNESEAKQEEVAATFQTTTNNTNNTNFRGNYRGSNYRGNQNQTYRGAGNGYRGTNPNRGGAGAGYRPNYNQANNSTNANTNNSGKTCIFCRKPNHIQDFCRARISQNAPCIDNQGKTYWPKVHANEEISSSSVFFLEN
jgi:hypothetical protein